MRPGGRDAPICIDLPVPDLDFDIDLVSACPNLSNASPEYFATSLVSTGPLKAEPVHYQPGDSVVLGDRAPPEFRHCPAIVTQAGEEHCTVTVLDKSRRFGIGECWPSFDDIQKDELGGSWRIGQRVIIQGLQGGKTKRLNDFTGIICLHPREGHPTFIRKPAEPERPQLTVCIRLDDPVAA